ncbi:MAG: hypothetical protein ACRCSN_18995 [Dermatophilaceae bacterium]
MSSTTLRLEPVDRTRITSATGSHRSGLLLAASTAIGALHHVDHVIRANHSGFPFTTDVNPFTISLVAYPVLGLAAAIRHRRPAVSAGLVVALTAATGLAHVLIEPPHDQYHPWAHGTNLAHVASAVTGVIAVIVAVGLMVALVTTALSLVADVRRLRRSGRAV